MEDMKHNIFPYHMSHSIFPQLRSQSFKLKHEEDYVKLKMESEDSEESYDLEAESVVCESEFLEVNLVEDTGSIKLTDLEMQDQMVDTAKIFSLSPELENLNKFRKRKINMDEWKDIKRKKLRDAGKAHVSRRGALVEGKHPSKQARVCKIECCTKEGCAKLTLKQKLQLFDEYYKLTYDEQSAYLLKRLAVLQPKRRKKEMSLLNEKDAVNIKHDDSSSLLCDQKSEVADAGNIKSDPEEEFELGVNELENNYIKYVYDPLKTEFQVKKEDNDSVSNLDKNMVVETSEDVYSFSCNEINIKIPCEICNSSFHSPSEFDSHMYEHQKENGIFVCVLCNKSFATERILRRHKYTHTLTSSPTQTITSSPTPKIISIPTQITSIPTQIITSSPTQIQTLIPIQIITSNPTICEVSQVSVYKEDDPKKHERMNVSVIDNPFKCGVCEQTFSLKSLLDLHVNFHKSSNNNNKRNVYIKLERIPVFCEVCNKKFARDYELKRHMNVHKALSCKFCEKIFTRKPSLKKHQIKCANKALYCKVCKR